jgi:hypothetical protein|eukprot:g1341.t1
MALTVPLQGVIDDKMIRASVISAIKQNYEEKAAARREREKKRGEEKKKTKIKFDQMEVDFEEIEILSLSFNNVSRISNLDGLKSLHTLKLDNNTIKVMENLEHLSNLTWLDLSFNNIEEISGLQSLTKLTDLTLFNNSISSLAGLEKLVNLNVLSIGNNNLSDVKEIKTLREFKKLNVLSMDGNPVCEDPEYKMIVLAFLSSIRFFDFILVDASDVTLAKEQYQDDLQELAEHEKMQQESEQTRSKKETTLKKYQDANIDPITTLMDVMFREDPETQKLLEAPLKGLDEIKSDYAERLSGLGEDVKGDGIKLYEDQKVELKDFQDATKSARDASQKKSVQIVSEYSAKEKTLFEEIRTRVETAMDEDEEVPPISEKDFDGLKSDLSGLKESLMENELLLSEECELILSEFEVRYGKMKEKSAEVMERYFRGAEDSENAYFEMVSALVSDLLEKATNDELEDVTDECRGLLADKETLNTSIATAHDTHLSKLLGVEEELRERALNQTKSLFAKSREEEWNRNRHAVMDIRSIYSNHTEAIQMFLSEMREEISAYE